ncbi:MAG TPA: lysophospholipid acyltransferase family protein [Xanthomonadales bacterium]|nr:lysophospholipid acyltransferase family protein [Xanthomonadales bacterium]
MSAPELTPARPAAPRDRARPLRYALRTPALLVHLLVGLPITLLALLPPHRALRLASGERFDHRAIRWWSAMLVRIFGLELVRVGQPLNGAALFVANHLSWMDIEILHSQRMMCFVAKSEIERWPFVGWLAGRAGTIYHRRGSTESLSSVSQVMVERLRDGLGVGVFPEGGTGPGDHVRTFHARIFQAAIDAGVPAQPVALRFSRDGRYDTAIAFRPRENFLQNFVRVLGEPATRAEVIFCEPVPTQGEGRRRIAETARSRIVAALGVPDRRRANEPSTDELDPLAEEEA